jgi:hypothetical protein
MVTAMTMIVNRCESSRVGQVTLRISPRVSRRYLTNALGCFSFFSGAAFLTEPLRFSILSSSANFYFTSKGKVRPLRRTFIKIIQGVQDLNPQPTVLETVALPIELTPYPGLTQEVRHQDRVNLLTY